MTEKPFKQRWTEFKDKVATNPVVEKFLNFCRTLVIPGFQGIPLWTVMKFFFESMVKGILFQRAAAMTYRIFVALIPMLLALFSVISFLGEDLKVSLLTFIESIVPDMAWPAVEKTITGVIMVNNGPLLYFSIFMGIYLTLLSMNAIINTLNITYFNIKRQKLIKQLAVSLALVIVFGIGIILALGVFIGNLYIIHNINKLFFDSPTFLLFSVAVCKWLLTAIIVYLFLSTLFYIAPADKKYFRFFSAGSTFATIALIILLYALNFYFSNFSAYNLIYGSIGALFVILLWLYWSSAVILIGFDLNVSIYVAQQEQKEKENQDLVLESKVTE